MVQPADMLVLTGVDAEAVRKVCQHLGWPDPVVISTRHRWAVAAAVRSSSEDARAASRGAGLEEYGAIDWQTAG